jgi:hypothetical protein
VNGRKKAVYFMPLTQSHFISHQWIRELKRSGARVLVGVYFRLPSSELVWAGQYNREHRWITLGTAIKELNSLSDPLGYELFITRSIVAGEIQKIRAVPQKTGWRYMPHAHGKPLCGCPMCLPKGLFKSKHLRERLDPVEKSPSLNEVKAQLLQDPTPDQVMYLLHALRSKRRRTDPAFMLPLMSAAAASVREDVALTLPFFRHPESTRMLKVLAKDPDPIVSVPALEGLQEIAARSGQK